MVAVPVVVLGSLAVAAGPAVTPAATGHYVAAQPAGGPGVGHHSVCGAVPAGFARCNAVQLDLVRPDRKPHPSPTPTPTPTPTSSPTPTPTPGSCPDRTISGYEPCDLQKAYSLPSSAPSSSEVVAIVDAYDDPTALNDVNTYRNTFGIPLLTDGSTFRKVNPSGVLPTANSGWAQEISLDLDMVSAICPNCSILLVEATSNSLNDLATAANYAGNASGVVAESNSYGGGEFCSFRGCETSFDSDYDHAGVAVTASTGDSGYGVQYPAASPYVTAVGGTSLLLNSDGTRSSETVWSGAGSGCSAVESSLSWQQNLTNISNYCSRRAVADVAADADPNTGVAVYDTYQASGWLVFGGTSVASPIVASVYALAGNTATTSKGSSGASYTYDPALVGNLYDVTSGSNGSCGNDLCNGATGWDGPTGLGTPIGTGAF